MLVLNVVWMINVCVFYLYFLIMLILLIECVVNVWWILCYKVVVRCWLVVMYCWRVILFGYVFLWVNLMVCKLCVVKFVDFVYKLSNLVLCWLSNCLVKELKRFWSVFIVIMNNGKFMFVCIDWLFILYWLRVLW